jgi:prophage antirepressor-like protein
MELIKQLDDKLTFNKKEVRLVGTYEEPWFVAKDVCDILEVTDVSVALCKIPEDDGRGQKFYLPLVEDYITKI